VGKGDTVRFWHDRRCGDRPLKEMFPLLFECSRDRDAYIDALYTRISGGEDCDWHIRFGRAFNDWEIEEVASFFQLLQVKSPTRVDVDKMRWDLKKNEAFDIRSYYLALRGSENISFPWKGIWGVKAPRRIAFFVWTASWGRILTCDNLRRRGIVLVWWCWMCRCSGETVDHLLLHCPVAREIRSYVFQLFGCGVGDLGLCDGDGGRLEELVWETLLGGLEPCPALCNVVHMEGEE
jgi:hypothetical protein